MSDNNSIEVRLARLEERVKSFDLARELQAKEYARRLDELNHAHERAVADRAGTVTRTVCDLRHSVIDGKVSELKENQAISKGKSLAYAFGITIVLALLALILKVFK